ncbi:MAG TPA: GMC oxidoreductase [Streptosporangiaceae bacterium]|jgi:choline dehydrogenase
MGNPAFDYVIVGGGTAGSVLAARLSEDPGVRVCVIEGGPSDAGDERVLNLRNWINLLGTELDYDYPTVEQPYGNSHIRHSRARVLGGCSSHNTLISFRPFAQDLDDWVAAGATGWDPAAMGRYLDRIACEIAPVADKDRNPIARDFVTAASRALSVPVVDDFNAKPFADGAGFFSVAYQPRNGNRRSSASVAYLHPIMGTRPNLTIMTETWASGLTFDGGTATGATVRHRDGTTEDVRAEREVILCAGAVDTPRLLLHSGIGPAGDLRALGIDVRADLPGVGENLLDHPESVIVWETDGPIPPESVMDSDAGLFVRRDADDSGDPRPDLMFHFYQVPFCEHTSRLGYPVPAHGVSMTPNIPRARSRGRLWLTSADPSVKPALDFRYFTDPDGYDARTLVDGIRVAREVAAMEPLASWLVREVAPGPGVQDDDGISAYARSVAHTVYHPAGTCRMGAADDPLAVVGPDLRVRGVGGLRIADASVFPSLPSPNPMVTVLMVGERAADLVRDPRT